MYYGRNIIRFTVYTAARHRQGNQHTIGS